jgi:glutathione S-transferase
MLLVIGDPALSSWSLRPYLILAHSGLPFETRLVRLDQHDTRANNLKFSPTGKVPVLVDPELGSIWDSLAIAETLAERCPALWPQGVVDRARARAITCEMHAGFAALRREHPMLLGQQVAHVERSAACLADIQRVDQLVGDARASAQGGPWLFGAWSIADAFYAPVATRFRTHGVIGSGLLSGPVEAWCEEVLADPALLAWTNGALGSAARGAGSTVFG